MNATPAPFSGGRRPMRVALVVAALGAVACFVAAVVDSPAFFHAWLIAWTWAVTIAVGALVLLMTCNAMRATWPVALRRIVETVAGTLPLLALLAVPLLFGLDVLYPWLRPETIQDEHARHLIEHKRPYLNLPFFLVRAGLYLACWIGCAALLRSWSLRADRKPDPNAGPRAYRLSGTMLPAVALTLTFASFDWTMSLTPTWFSTMYPVYWFAGGFLAAIAVVTVAAAAARTSGDLPISGSHFYALGRLLLAFTVFWAYVAFFQFMLIWMANKPEEVEFYLARAAEPWLPVSIALALSRFVLPFALLLSYRLKWRPIQLGAVAAWICASHWFDVHWLVGPAVRTARAFHWADAAALATVAGATIAFALWRLRGHHLLPVGDPALPAALAYDSR